MRLMALNWTRWSSMASRPGVDSPQGPEATASESHQHHWNGSLEERRSASILSGTGRPSGGPVVASQRPLLRLKLMKMNLMNNGSSGVASELRFVATGRSFARNHPEPIVKHY